MLDICKTIQPVGRRTPNEPAPILAFLSRLEVFQQSYKIKQGNWSWPIYIVEQLLMLCVNTRHVLHQNPIYQPEANIEEENDSVPMIEGLSNMDKVAVAEIQSCSTETSSGTEVDLCPSCPKA